MWVSTASLPQSFNMYVFDSVISSPNHDQPSHSLIFKAKAPPSNQTTRSETSPLRHDVAQKI
jgi:hypothetical protein